MNWLSDHVYILTFVAAYLTLMVVHAWQGKKSTRDITDYFIGGRRMGGISIGLSFFATYASTNSFVGFAGKGYDIGGSWLMLGVFAVFFTMIAWRHVAPRMRHVTGVLNSITVPDFIGFRFSSTAARVMAALIVVGASVLYLTAIFKGAGNLLAAALDLSYPVAVWAVFGVVVLYTSVGGFVSVVKTDVVQGLTMLVAAIILFFTVADLAGGVTAIADLAPQKATVPVEWSANAVSLPVLFGVMLASTMKFIVEPRQLSRFYALQDGHAVRRGFWISTFAILLVFFLLTPVGLYARHIFPDGTMETDLIVPTLLANGNYIAPALGAFLIVAMIAAAMSSIDSVLLVTAATFERDISGLMLSNKSDAAALMSTRIYVVVFAFLTTLVALNPPGDIVTITALSGSVYAACFFPVLVFGLFWRRGSGLSAVTSIVAGLLVLVVATITEAFTPVHPIFPAITASTLVYIFVARITPPGDMDVVRKLF